MGILLHFQAISRSRAARSAKSFNVTPAAFAVGKATTADHHSGGMELRCHHLVTTHSPAPVSVRSASRVGQSSMIERKDDSSDIGAGLGQTVPKVKVILSRDRDFQRGHNVLMDDAASDKEWDAAFRARLRAAREPRTQEVMAKLLGIEHEAYKKYENRAGRAFPIRLLPKFADICGKTLEWLIEAKEPKAKKTVRKRAARAA